MHITKEEQLVFINTHMIAYIGNPTESTKKGIKLKSLARSSVKRIIEKLNYISIYTSNENFLIGKKYLK